MRSHRHFHTLFLCLAGIGLTAATASAQTPPRLAGPVIEPFGATFAPPADAWTPAPSTDLKVAFDVAAANPDPKAINSGIDTIARYLNMHARAGMPAANVKAALVVHGTAARDMLSHDAYRKRHGIDNPNLPLLDALHRAGVRIYLCAQSAAGRGIQWDEVAPPVKVALSAITAHALLAREGYSVNPF